jgi:2-furoyl-CoA dehydrogenase FAD binding subunit
VKPAPFEYVRAQELEQALGALAAHGSEAKVLAGGQSLVPALNMRLVRPALLVDVNRVAGLDGVAAENGSLLVGAVVRQSDLRLAIHPLLAEALPHVGHIVTRNRGTVAGSVAHADPAAELPLCLVLLDGAVHAVSARGDREIAAGDFFHAPYSTALEPDELVVETRWPIREWGYAFEEFAQRGGDYALATAAACAQGDDLRVAIGSVVERPGVLDVDPEHPGDSAAEQIEPWSSIHASVEYQRQLVRVLVDRAAARARAGAKA